MAEAIRAEDLTKAFETVTAVDGITFSVEEGEVFGVLGPNGAGKTTLIRLLNGILAPSRGKARIFGMDVAAEGPAVRQMTGVLTETPSHYERLTARQNLSFYATLYGIPEEFVSSAVERSLSRFGLTGRGDEPVGGFSTGMKQRLALARALIHDPRVIFLDEPTAGLDPEAARQVDKMVGELVESGERTVLLSTHNLHEAEMLCDRVAMLSRGKFLAVGSIRELSEKIWQVRPLDIEFLLPPPPAVPASLSKMPGVSILSQNAAHMALQVDEKGKIPGVIADVIRNGGEILEVKAREYSLEEIYFAIQRQGRGEG